MTSQKTPKPKYITNASLDSVITRIENIEKTMATKDVLNKVALALVSLDHKVDTQFGYIDRKIDTLSMRLIDRMDYVVDRVKVFDRQSTINGQRLGEIEPVMKDHEARIVALESKKRS